MVQISQYLIVEGSGSPLRLLFFAILALIVSALLSPRKWYGSNSVLCSRLLRTWLAVGFLLIRPPWRTNTPASMRRCWCAFSTRGHRTWPRELTLRTARFVAGDVPQQGREAVAPFASLLLPPNQFIDGDIQRLSDIQHGLDGGVGRVAGFDLEESAVRDACLASKLILRQARFLSAFLDVRG